MGLSACWSSRPPRQKEHAEGPLDAVCNLLCRVPCSGLGGAHFTVPVAASSVVLFELGIGCSKSLNEFAQLRSSGHLTAEELPAAERTLLAM